ncbi:hypothetical protein [Pedobacter jeongneungensis]|nr:hypothetical protein [Pedobacter jeongneungensis]
MPKRDNAAIRAIKPGAEEKNMEDVKLDDGINSAMISGICGINPS